MLKTEVKFLSHIISSKGIKTDQTKIEAVQKFKIPKCVKNLRSYLELCNYYRLFIEKYSEKSRLLEALCGKNNDKLVWSEDWDESFNALKNALQLASVSKMNSL